MVRISWLDIRVVEPGAHGVIEPGVVERSADI